MRKIILSANAGDYLRCEKAYLASFNPRAADTAMRQLHSAFRLLAGYPQAGLADTKLPGRRIYVAGNYIIAYRVEPDAIKISYIRHGRQQAPDLDKDEGADIPDTD
ncbi:MULTISPECIES: type II toxin-antitoxin system RelE/ParE family toxin [unclassified Rhizobium]|uniref:type II toxin-antitoxin system RelE/ParE family toxin n=1 Tax=unclassified Rhizobium TaxID=2613769 RepID=UPI001ADACBD5|nr:MULTISPECIES: type II toxin-antitoxin system RelE/ParE family toxin [unclassified Rhizobium]MBO9097823.1 type II toxin-antitoxin system RelE/ParE family toxin [Rhizobium sp. L58/93]MBO9133395.1 type II toxin-antitoxin system RelE/ParE family toxin [Rhizobium sp. B209b/85]MBO9167974.1 type II toxin-antitoxin system RelE/ParE family toxin [Rhizobium sp. L245/93]MBO9184019.1 type II toxin-antitoxin system RelE/ParE family toxin [Rhizobium sp. E27B/91]QXZ84244.1 type II toxin-antitoxin system R